MGVENTKNMKSLKLYTTVKFEIERLVDSMLAPVNRDSDEEIDFTYDAYIDEDDLVMEVEMPGLEPENVHIEGIDKFIELSGEKDTVKRKYKNCIGLERANGKFKKILYLDRPVNIHTATATLEEGVLTLRFPIVEEKRAKKIIKLEY